MGRKKREAVIAACLGLVVAFSLPAQTISASEGISAQETKTEIPDSEIIKNDETGIPDPVFYEKVKQFDVNGDGILTKSEAAVKAYRLGLGGFGGQKIKNIKGIEYFINTSRIELAVGAGTAEHRDYGHFRIKKSETAQLSGSGG